MVITIKGYELQYRLRAPRTWRVVERSDNPIMAPALNALPNAVRDRGYGEYQIVKFLSDGRRVVMFKAELLEYPVVFPPTEIHED